MAVAMVIAYVVMLSLARSKMADAKTDIIMLALIKSRILNHKYSVAMGIHVHK